MGKRLHLSASVKSEQFGTYPRVLPTVTGLNEMHVPDKQ